MFIEVMGLLQVDDIPPKDRKPIHAIGWIMRAIMYLGIGALVHAWFIGSEFDMKNLWSWGYLLAWPIPMFGWLVMTVAVIGAWILALVAICVVMYGLWEIGADWRREIRHKALLRAAERERYDANQ